MLERLSMTYEGDDALELRSMGKTTLDDLTRVHGKPTHVTYLPPPKRGARMSLGNPPPSSRVVDKARWSCGLEAEITFGGHYRLLKQCLDANHVETLDL